MQVKQKQGQAIGASLQKIWKSHSIPISTKIYDTTNESASDVDCSDVRLLQLDTQKK